MTPPDDRSARLEQMLGLPGPYILVVAGPNGAGKTTFVNHYIKPSGLRVVNPDDIARGLGTDDPAQAAYEAADVAEAVRRKLVVERVSFCMETVFSDPSGATVAFLRDAQVQGYFVCLVFIGLDHPDLSIGRVMQRVEAGGHDVPDESSSPVFRGRWRTCARYCCWRTTRSFSTTVPLTILTAWSRN